MEDITSRMLQGWKMLASHCPVCSTVLLQKNEEIYCAVCKANCVHENKTQSQSSLPLEAKQAPNPPPPGPQESKSESQRFTELMLEGWVMIDDTCTKLHAMGNQGTSRQCAYPLLKDQEGKRICVKCDLVRDWKEEERKQDLSAAPEEKGSSAPPAVSSDHTDTPEDAIMGPSEWQNHQKKRDQTSAELGKRLMQGWTMLDQTCTGNNGSCTTPLMKNPADSSIVCVTCNAVISNGNGSSRRRPQEQKTSGPMINQKVKKIGETGASRSTPAAVADTIGVTSLKDLMNPTKDDTSDLIGQHLLKGWTLLAEMCQVPQCATPLMRDQQQQVWCFKCKKMVVHPRKEDQPQSQDQEREGLFTSDRTARSGSGAKRKQSWDETLEETADCIIKELKSAQVQLKTSNRVEEKIELAKLIQEYVKTLQCLKNLNDKKC